MDSESGPRAPIETSLNGIKKVLKREEYGEKASPRSGGGDGTRRLIRKIRVRCDGRSRPPTLAYALDNRHHHNIWPGQGRS